MITKNQFPNTCSRIDLVEKYHYKEVTLLEGCGGPTEDILTRIIINTIITNIDIIKRNRDKTF